MNPTEELRAFLIGKFKTEFAVAHPTTEIRYENVRISQLKNLTTPLVYVMDEPVQKRRISIGSKQLRLSGILHVFAMAPEDTGSKALRELVDTTARIFDWLDVYVPNVGYLRTKEISYDTITLYRSMYTLRIAINYDCDLC